MHEVISSNDTIQRFAHTLLVENIAFGYFGSQKPSAKASGVASKATNGMAALE